MLLELACCSIVFWHWAATDLPWIWKPFAIANLEFPAAFARAWRRCP
jgi:hypothetical protein